MLRRKIVEGQQGITILDQAIGCFRILGFPGLHKEIEGLARFGPRGRYSWQEGTLPQFNRWLVQRYTKHWPGKPSANGAASNGLYATPAQATPSA